MKKSILSKIYIIVSVFIMVLTFQNCSKVGFAEDGSALAFKGDSSGRNAGDDGMLGGGEIPGDDGAIGRNGNDGDDPDVSMDEEDDSDSEWLYLPGGRGHVPMSAVAICPAGSKDAGLQKCPFFCYKGVDMSVHRSLARNYFVKHADEQPNYGGGAVPGTCANPDLKTKK